MRVNAVNRVMDLLTLANKSNEEFNSNHKQRIHNKNNSTNIKKDNERDTFQLSHNAINQAASSEYKIDNNGIFKKVIEFGDNFVYEDYIVELLYSNHETFRKQYDKINEISFPELPEYTQNIVEVIVLLCNQRKFYIDEDKMYDTIFKKYRIDLAINFFYNNVNDVIVSKDKLMKIYKNVEKVDKYVLSTAQEEVMRFIDFIELMST